MTSHFYYNGYIKAFLIIDNKPIYLENFIIDTIKLDRSKALFTQALMPNKPNLLLNFPENAQIDLVNKAVGRWDVYEKEQVIIRLTNCTMRHNWIPNSVGYSIEQKELRVFAVVSCDIEVMNENN